MDVSVKLVCPCRPGFSYKNGSTFSQHRHTKTHRAWESDRDNKNDRIRSKEFENEIVRLRNKLAQRDEVEKELLNRIKQLEYNLDYYINATRVYTER
jgi:hypothetical protein